MSVLLSIDNDFTFHITIDVHRYKLEYDKKI